MASLARRYPARGRTPPTDFRTRARRRPA